MIGMAIEFITQWDMNLVRYGQSVRFVLTRSFTISECDLNRENILHYKHAYSKVGKKLLLKSCPCCFKCVMYTVQCLAKLCASNSLLKKRSDCSDFDL